MEDYLRNQRLMRAPEFSPGDWLNTEHPLRLNGLRGQVILLDLWDYTCINCLRTLPVVQQWYRRYASLGLTVIGIHTPAFGFGRERQQVELAVRELDIRYPVLLDNEFRMWRGFDNQFWPARYLIDQHGMVRYSDFGEGGFAEFEQAIHVLLREANPNVDLPPVMPEDDRPVRTRELHGGLERGALGNPEGYAANIPMIYRLPSRRVEGAFYVAGAWQAGSEYLAYKGSSEGIIQLPYEAVEVNAILSPHPELVERMLNPEAVSIEIWQDDRPITDERRGLDMTDDGRVLLNRPRIYNLVRNPGTERHELTLRVHARGVALYAFAFVG